MSGSREPADTEKLRPGFQVACVTMEPHIEQTTTLLSRLRSITWAHLESWIYSILCLDPAKFCGVRLQRRSIAYDLFKNLSKIIYS